MTDPAPLTVDDLVTGRAAEELGPGIIPTAAILIVETISDEGQGLRYVRSQGLTLWAAIGLLRSILLRVEADDLAAWGDDEP